MDQSQNDVIVGLFDANQISSFIATIIIENYVKAVRRQNIWRNSRRRLAECRPRLGIDVRRRACGVASADVRWSVA